MRVDGLREMGPLLWEFWDPLGLAELGVPDDEYDTYAAVLASKLKRGNARADLVHYLTFTLSDPADHIAPVWRARCERAADALLEWYANSNAPGT